MLGNKPTTLTPIEALVWLVSLAGTRASTCEYLIRSSLLSPLSAPTFVIHDYSNLKSQRLIAQCVSVCLSPAPSEGLLGRLLGMGMDPSPAE